MKVIYVAGPIRRGNIWENVAQADDAMLDLMKSGYSVINPMLSCWAGAAREWFASVERQKSQFDGTGLSPFIVRPTGMQPHPLAHGEFRELGAEPWLTMDLELVKRSDAVLRLPGDSSGADGEVEHATKLGIPVFYRIEDLKAFFGDQK